MSIAEETRDLRNYTEKCNQRNAITANRNKELELRAAEAQGRGSRMSQGSDDDMEITGSRKNGKVAKSIQLAALKSRRKKRVVVSPRNNNEPLEVHDSDSDTLPAGDPPHGTPSQALIVDSPSPKKKRAPKKNAASRSKTFKSNEFILDDVDDDEPQAREREDAEEDENMYDPAFINDASSDVQAASPHAKQNRSNSKGKEKEKARTRTAVSMTSKRKKQARTYEPIENNDPTLHEDEDFVPDSADEAPVAPAPRSTRKGKQKQLEQRDHYVEDEESVVPVYPMDLAYSDGPDEEGEQTETEAPGPSTRKQPRNPRVAALADEEGNETATSSNDDEFADDDLVDLTEEDPIDMGVIDVDLYDDAPSQRFRDFEADYGQVKREPGMADVDGDVNAGVDEFDDITFDQSFMDNLDDYDYQDPGPDLNGDSPTVVAGAATTYTRAALGVDYDDVQSEDEDDAERFVPISELSEADRDFFLNHWRRSATEAVGLVGSEKQLAEARQQSARGTANPRGRGRGGRSGGGGKWRGGRASWRGRR